MRRRPPGRTPPPRQDQVEELLATVAHELRRPLTALLGALATVQQRGPALSAAQQQELLVQQTGHRRAPANHRMLIVLRS